MTLVYYEYYGFIFQYTILLFSGRTLIACEGAVGSEIDAAAIPLNAVNPSASARNPCILSLTKVRERFNIFTGLVIVTIVVVTAVIKSRYL